MVADLQVREPAIDLSSYSESPDKPFGKQDTQVHSQASLVRYHSVLGMVLNYGYAAIC